MNTRQKLQAIRDSLDELDSKDIDIISAVADEFVEGITNAENTIDELLELVA